MRLDGLAALRQLLVELLAARDRLLVQLGLQAGGLLGVLLEDALRLRPGLAHLALGVGAQLIGLDLGITEQLLGLIAEVAAAVVGRPGRQTAARLVQLGAQHLDLIAEVLGVLDGLLPLGLQPFHLGLEPREVVDVGHAALAPGVRSPALRGPIRPLVASLSKRAPSIGRTGPPGNGVRSTAEHGLPPRRSSPETWTPALGHAALRAA